MNFARRTSCNRCGRGESFSVQAEISCRALIDLKTAILNQVVLFCCVLLFCSVSTEKTTEAKMMKAGGTEIGKTLAEKSRGLFSANDWQCKTYVCIKYVCAVVVGFI